MPIILPFPPFSVLRLSQTRHFKKLLITEPRAKHHGYFRFSRHYKSYAPQGNQRCGSRTSTSDHTDWNESLTDGWQNGAKLRLWSLYTRQLLHRHENLTGEGFCLRWFRRDFFNGAKLHCATPVFESGSSHIGKVYPTLSRNVNWYSDRSVSKWVGARTGIDWDESEHLEKRTGI